MAMTWRCDSPYGMGSNELPFLLPGSTFFVFSKDGTLKNTGRISAPWDRYAWTAAYQIKTDLVLDLVPNSVLSWTWDQQGDPCNARLDSVSLPDTDALTAWLSVIEYETGGNKEVISVTAMSEVLKAHYGEDVVWLPEWSPESSVAPMRYPEVWHRQEKHLALSQYIDSLPEGKTVKIFSPLFDTERESSSTGIREILLVDDFTTTWTWLLSDRYHTPLDKDDPAVILCSKETLSSPDEICAILQQWCQEKWERDDIVFEWDHTAHAHDPITSLLGEVIENLIAKENPESENE